MRICSLLLVAVPLSIMAFDNYRCSEVCLHCDNSSHSINVQSLDDAFAKGSIDGHIRMAHIYQREDTPNTPDSYATAIGGELKYETAKFYNISAALSTFISQKISPLSGTFDKGTLNTDFFNANGASFAYIGEAYLDFQKDKLDIRIGRQKLDTPLNDRDDVRMLPNTFEAFTIGYGGIEHFVFVASYVNRWAGIGSGQDISQFKDIPGKIAATGAEGKGALLLGVQNDSFANTEIQGWFYSFDKLAYVLYMDGVYHNDTLALAPLIALQYGHYNERDAFHGCRRCFWHTSRTGFRYVSLQCCF